MGLRLELRQRQHLRLQHRQRRLPHTLGGTVLGNNPSGSHNVDIAVSADGKFVYTINSQSGNIGIFAINQQDGSLTNLGQAGDLPKSVGFNGIAAL